MGTDHSRRALGQTRLVRVLFGVFYPVLFVAFLLYVHLFLFQIPRQPGALAIADKRLIGFLYLILLGLFMILNFWTLLLPTQNRIMLFLCGLLVPVAYFVFRCLVHS